jgi:cytochrome c oxidase cbb3-type subunit 4
MTTYDAIRHFADSWGLVFMGVLFVAFAGWAFRPGSKEVSAEVANMIFKDDDND